MRRFILGLAATALALLAPAAASAEPTWAPADSASVQPGVMTDTGGAQCTANFVFYDASNVYIGQAAHCAGTGAATDTDGCRSASRALGTPVGVEGATRPGTLAYSSWIAMRQAGEKDPNACAHNDFALVRLDPADVGRVNPSVPFWGGPAAGPGATSAPGDTVYSYGNSSLRAGLSPLKPKYGKSLGQEAGGWNHPVYTATPGIPGDSGSAFLSSDGRALGTLSTLSIAPLAGSNGVSDLSRELAYARSHGFPDLQLAAGTEPFSPVLP